MDISGIASYLVKIESEINDLHRCLDNLIRVGKVIEVDPANEKCRVKHGSLITPFVAWVMSSAGDVRAHRCPSVGERCVLLNLSGGELSSHTVALLGLSDPAFPASTHEPAHHLTAYPGGLSQLFDMSSGKLVINAPGGIEFNTPLLRCSVDIKADGEVTDHTRSMQADRDIYNGHDHNHGLVTSKPNQAQ